MPGTAKLNKTAQKEQDVSGALCLYCRSVPGYLLVHATLFALTLWPSAARNR